MTLLNVYMMQPNDQVKDFLESSGKIKAIYDPHALSKLDQFDAIYFDGGADVQPALYGEKDVASGIPNPKRDAWEVTLFQRTRRSHYHIGICRGSQLLWVVNGGKLWQDITGHAIYGTHGINTTDGKRIEGVTSTHHQAARVTHTFGKDRVLATERYEAPVRCRAANIDSEIDDIVEAHWHPNTRTFAVQGHPEYGAASEEYRNYFFDHLLFNEHTKIG